MTERTNVPESRGGGSFFEIFRLAELDATEFLIRRYGGEKCQILEIGAGTGWQARALSERGYRVSAIDLPADVEISNHARARVWPIKDYDGTTIPFADGSFDIIYSSNVLEHVVELEKLDTEIHRVLADGGCAIHLVPNSVWRLSSLISYYPAQALDLVRFLRRRSQLVADHPGATVYGSTRINTRRKGYLSKALKRVLPSTHGAVGTPISELWRFSRSRWNRFFQEHDWLVVEYGNNGIWVTGDYLVGHGLPLSVRRHIGKLVGGIAHVYVLRSNRK